MNNYLPFKSFFLASFLGLYVFQGASYAAKSTKVERALKGVRAHASNYGSYELIQNRIRQGKEAAKKGKTAAAEADKVVARIEQRSDLSHLKVTVKPFECPLCSHNLREGGAEHLTREHQFQGFTSSGGRSVYRKQESPLVLIEYHPSGQQPLDQRVHSMSSVEREAYWYRGGYTGDIDNPVWHGGGAVHSASGFQYHGRFREGSPTEGAMFLPEGNSGKFIPEPSSNGSQREWHGQLTVTADTKGTFTFKGQFLGGRPAKGEVQVVAPQLLQPLRRQETTWRVDKIADQRVVFSEGNHYEGAVHHLLPQGVGVLKLANGRRYEGDFLAGFMHGEGRVIGAEGGIYIGQFANRKYGGFGKLFLDGGEHYRGQFKQGHFGPYGGIYKGANEYSVGTFNRHRLLRGTLVTPIAEYTGSLQFSTRRKSIVYEVGELVSKSPKTTFKRYQGRFNENGVPEAGYARVEYVSSAKAHADVYEGGISKGSQSPDAKTVIPGHPKGIGAKIYESGVLYHGQFNQGHPAGLGFLERVDSPISGPWDLPSGTGQRMRIILSDGSHYEGQVLKGKRHGQGTYYPIAGEPQSGRWANDLLQKGKETPHPDGDGFGIQPPKGKAMSTPIPFPGSGA